MGAGVDLVRTAYGAGAVTPLPLSHTLVVAAVTLYLALAVVIGLFLLLGVATRRRPAVPPPSAVVPLPTPVVWAPDHLPAELAADALTQMLLARLARLAALAAEPEVRADPERLRLTRAALLSTYRDCQALGVIGQARALLQLPG